MKERHILFIYFAVGALVLFAPEMAYCSVESSLMAVQSKLISTILPLAAVLGLVFAGLSFVAGSPNARNHLMLAIMGAVIGFGAPSIIQFIQQLVN
jgi:type IV secretory pathway VirB2 component (pilin)